MKQIDYYIESNKKLMEEKIKNDIDKVEHYIKGLEDAKKYILEESE